MTPEDAARRAVACTATGALSGLPTWDWTEAMQPQYADNTGRWVRLARVHVRLYLHNTLELANGRTWFLDDPAELLPDFADDITVLAMLPLVRRAWTGYRVSIDHLPDGNVHVLISQYGPDASGDLRTRVPFSAENVPFYEALTLALEAAPETP